MRLSKESQHLLKCHGIAVATRVPSNLPRAAKVLLVLNELRMHKFNRYLQFTGNPGAFRPENESKLLTGREVDSGDVGAVHARPVLKGALLNVKQILAHLNGRVGFGSNSVTGDAGVVDQNAETPLARLDLLDEP